MDFFESFAALIKLIIRAIFFLIAAIVTPPFIAAHVILDGEKPFLLNFWRRYRKVLVEIFDASLT